MTKKIIFTQDNIDKLSKFFKPSTNEEDMRSSEYAKSVVTALLNLNDFDDYDGLMHSKDVLPVVVMLVQQFALNIEVEFMLGDEDMFIPERILSLKILSPAVLHIEKAEREMDDITVEEVSSGISSEVSDDEIKIDEVYDDAEEFDEEAKEEFENADALENIFVFLKELYDLDLTDDDYDFDTFKVFSSDKDDVVTRCSVKDIFEEIKKTKRAFKWLEKYLNY